MLPLAIDVDGVFAGQVTVSNILRGLGAVRPDRLLDRPALRRSRLRPVAVALVIDYCFGGLGLHRIEVAIRPENTASLRVVEKLGLREYGFSPRYLHIDDEWRDHRLFEVTAEECPAGMLARLDPLRSRSHQSHK